MYLEPHLDHGILRDVQERRWASALNALALLNELHAPMVRLGRALAEASFSELRFSQLLRAREEQLEAQVRRAARLLASKGSRVDVTGFLDLLLSQDAPYAEQIRRRIARDFFYVPAKEQ
jgi:CRISPR system Cascade subunit CasB